MVGDAAPAPPGALMRAMELPAIASWLAHRFHTSQVIEERCSAAEFGLTGWVADGGG